MHRWMCVGGGKETRKEKSSMMGTYFSSNTQPQHLLPPVKAGVLRKEKGGSEDLNSPNGGDGR